MQAYRATPRKPGFRGKGAGLLSLHGDRDAARDERRQVSDHGHVVGRHAEAHRGGHDVPLAQGEVVDAVLRAGEVEVEVAVRLQRGVGFALPVEAAAFAGEPLHGVAGTVVDRIAFGLEQVEHRLVVDGREEDGIASRPVLERPYDVKGRA